MVATYFQQPAAEVVSTKDIIIIEEPTAVDAIPKVPNLCDSKEDAQSISALSEDASEQYPKVSIKLD